MKFKFMVDKLTFNCCNGVEEQPSINDIIETFNSTIKLNQGIITFEILLAKLISFFNADHGFINRVESNGIVKYIPIASHHLPVTDTFFIKSFINTPLYHDDVFVGTFGIGGKKVNYKLLDTIQPLLRILAKYLYQYTK